MRSKTEIGSQEEKRQIRANGKLAEIWEDTEVIQDQLGGFFDSGALGCVDEFKGGRWADGGEHALINLVKSN